MNTIPRRSHLITGTLFLLLSGLWTTSHAAPIIEVFKSPTCGCCKGWVEHLQENGLNVKTYDTANVAPFKKRLGVPQQLSSCHTAVIDGYVIEGHVPARDIYRLLKERPEVIGLTVPGMPVGSPGMEMGKRKDPYAVLTFDKQGSTTPFSQY